MGATGLARGRSQAIRPWPDEEACEGKDGAANEILAIYFWKNVELMSQKCQKSLSRRDGDIITSRLLPKVRLGCLAPPALRLALRYICLQSRSLCSCDGTPVFGSSCAVPPQQSVGLFSVRVGCSVAWKFRLDTNTWNGANDHE